jgi:hypothetical protein
MPAVFRDGLTMVRHRMILAHPQIDVVVFGRPKGACAPRKAPGFVDGSDGHGNYPETMVSGLSVEPSSTTMISCAGNGLADNATDRLVQERGVIIGSDDHRDGACCVQSCTEQSRIHLASHQLLSLAIIK